MLASFRGEGCPILIHGDTSPNFQEQNGLSRVNRPVVFGEKCREKHCLDKRFKESLSAWVPISGVRIWKTEKRWKAYTRLCRYLLRVIPTTRVFPNVVKFTYIASTANYLIQAADLFSNLTLNAIRHRMGATGDLVRLKYEMLCSVMDKDPIDAELLKSFSVSFGKVNCINNDLFARINLTS
jgi:hypothetical protein